MPKKKKAAPPKAGEDEAPAPKKIKEQTDSAAADTPWKRYFARRDAVLDEKAPGPFKGLGFMLIRGMAHTEEERHEDSSDEEDDDAEEKAQDEWTDAEMDYMRWVIITQRRADELENMKELVLGEQAGDSLLMFNTSFSYEIMDSFGELASEVKKTKDFGAKLDKLFAYTYTIDQHDVWVHDHECGWGGERFIAGLAKLWKVVLKKPDVRRHRLDTSLLPCFQLFCSLLAWVRRVFELWQC
eukprot:SAG31_NODE_108_length_24741_cov_6.933041_12_plen_241_part_00